jgi:hypothetical protein
MLSSCTCSSGEHIYIYNPQAIFCALFCFVLLEMGFLIVFCFVQLCYFPNPECQKTVPIRVSLNGQDFTLDPDVPLNYHYDNSWTYSALEMESFTAPAPL